MTLKNIETIISNPDIINALVDLRNLYYHRHDNGEANAKYKRELRLFSYRESSRKKHRQFEQKILTLFVNFNS